MKKWILAHRAAVGWIGAAIALAIATIYFFVVPAETSEVDGLGWAILRFGHSVVWLLLALTAVGFALRWADKLVSGFAWAALAVYAAFLAMLFFGARA